MRAFVSGQLKEKKRVRAVYSKLSEIGIDISHDWTRTDNLIDYLKNADEAGRRAALDIRGILDADIYILMTDNEFCGKGMYVELGAALALAEIKGAPEVCIVGPMNHESIFYHHPHANYFLDIESCLEHIHQTHIDTIRPNSTVKIAKIASGQRTLRRL